MRLLFIGQWVENDTDLDAVVDALQPFKVPGTDAYAVMYAEGDAMGDKTFGALREAVEKKEAIHVPGCAWLESATGDAGTEAELCDCGTYYCEDEA